MNEIILTGNIPGFTSNAKGMCSKLHPQWCGGFPPFRTIVDAPQNSFEHYALAKYFGKRFVSCEH